MTCRGIRGATTAHANNENAIVEATQELLQAIVAANELDPADLASAVFTATPDLNAIHPALAARRLGWHHVPLLSAAEIAVPESVPLCIRVLLHWNTDRPSFAITHVYLRDAVQLRPDLQVDEEEIKAKAPAPAPTRVAVPVYSGGPLSVAYQGEPGANSQEAIFQHFGAHVNTLACHSFEDIFHAVEDGRATLGLLPVENSQAGSINQAYDLLLDHDLRVVGEVKFRVHHCLLAVPGTKIEDIVRVRSHPQALAQCDRYLQTRGWEAVPAYDTAGAARQLAAHPEPGTARHRQRAGRPDLWPGSAGRRHRRLSG